MLESVEKLTVSPPNRQNPLRRQIFLVEDSFSVLARLWRFGGNNCLFQRSLLRIFKNTALLYLFIILFTTSCARRTIGYEIKGALEKRPYKGVVGIIPLKDQRPEEERIGRMRRFMDFPSSDARFKDSVSGAITEIIRKEFNKSGLETYILFGEKNMPPDYILVGEMKHFTAVVHYPKAMLVPYLGTASTLWETDDFAIAVEMHLRLTEKASGRVFIDKDYGISQDLRLRTGPLNINRLFGRGMGYKYKLLNKALEDVILQVRNEILQEVAKNENTDYTESR